MIVNVNPYDTGFDENSHVMKFAALAREVYTLKGAQRDPSPTKPVLGSVSNAKKRELEVAHPSLVNSKTTKRKVTIEGRDKGRKTETVLEIFEGCFVCLSITHDADRARTEDEDKGGSGDNDDDDEPINPLVDALFDEVEELRMRVSFVSFLSSTRY
jgi:kinesin family member 20